MERVFEDDDLLEEILLRLPAEIVHACKPVSKRWCNLISSPSFRRRHHSSSNSRSSSSSKILMIDRREGSVQSLLEVCNGVTVLKTSYIHPVPSIQPFHRKLCRKIDKYKFSKFRIVDVHNGLFLFSLTRKRNRREIYYLVCNPLTKEYHELPRTEKQKYSHSPEVAFAPSSIPSNHYKVIHVSVQSAIAGADIVEVYSSETGIWKELRHIDRRHFVSLYNSSYVVWDNCLFLVGQCLWSGGMCVLDSEGLCVCSSILVSSLIEMGGLIRYLGESGGILYAIVLYTCFADKLDHYKLWEMKEVDGSWNEKFQFKAKTVQLPLYVHRDGEHVWLSLLQSGKVYYCLDCNTERMEEAGDEVKDTSDLNIRSYSPTLFPLGG